ncbi:MAG: SpoIIE family protein phosphatase [Candidatus Atribacteria bacterium]|nr:SpoIIE family protein phosphatase [Candidatus Atribacteria bacterium]
MAMRHLMQFGMVRRALEEEKVCGDAYFIKAFENKVLITVIDGLGHGPGAAVAANTAVEYIKNNYKNGLTDIIKGCHREMKETRGAVIGIALIDLKSSILRYTGVGNIKVMVKSQTVFRPISINGILGYNLHKVKETEFPFNPGDLVLLHSDGISKRFDLNLYPPEFFGQHPQAIVERIMAEFGSKRDDLCIVAAREDKRETYGSGKEKDGQL